MKIAIVTDAWLPQTNGVVTTLQRTTAELEAMGFEVHVFTPAPYRTIPCPTYPEIRLSLFAGRRLRRALKAFSPDAIHIATEGPLGLAARRHCLRERLAFTTSYHTQFPAYVRKRLPIPESWTYRFVRWFHNAAHATLAPTRAIVETLHEQGFHNPQLWGRGVDTRLFRPSDFPRNRAGEATYLYVGRIAVEKNIEAFAALPLVGRKVIVGDGPALASLRERFPDCIFTGYLYGEALAAKIASADVFVFPSRTDTFGLVMLEAMACGVPVAAYPVTGPIDVVVDGVTGALEPSLQRACERARTLDRSDCREYALQHSWARCTRQFVEQLVTVRSGRMESTERIVEITNIRGNDELVARRPAA